MTQTLRQRTDLHNRQAALARLRRENDRTRRLADRLCIALLAAILAGAYLFVSWNDYPITDIENHQRTAQR